MYLTGTLREKTGLASGISHLALEIELRKVLVRVPQGGLTRRTHKYQPHRQSLRSNALIRQVEIPPHDQHHSFDGLALSVFPALLRSRIDDRPVRLNSGTGSEACRFQTTPSHDMEYRFSLRDQIIGNNPPVAAPPHGFRTHDRAASSGPLVEQVFETRPERRRERVVGVVVETLVRPETVDVPRQPFAFPAQAPQGCHMLIGNAAGCQGRWQSLLVELRIGSRSRHLPDIHDPFHPGFGQQCHEVLNAAVGVADGEKWKRHVSPASCVFEGVPLVGRDMIGLVAFDLVLGIVFAGVMRVSLVVEVCRMHLDDRSRHVTSLGIPADVITDFEPFRHLGKLLFKNTRGLFLFRVENDGGLCGQDTERERLQKVQFDDGAGMV